MVGLSLGFVRRDKAFSLDPPGGLTTYDLLSMLGVGAQRGLGLAYTTDLVAAEALASPALEDVLRPRLPITQGLFPYFLRCNRTKLRLFIDAAPPVMRTP